MRKVIIFLLVFSLVSSSIMVSSASSIKQTPAPTDIALNTVVPKVSIKNNEIVINWPAVKNAEGYHIFRSLDQNEEFDLIDYTIGTSYTDSNTSAGTEYYYMIEAFAGNSTSKLSNVVKSIAPTPKPTPQLKPPANIRVVNKGNYNLVTWNKVNGASRYVLYRSTDNNKHFVNISSTEHLEYNDSNIEKGRVYYYRVESIDGPNISKQSPEKKILVPSPTPIAYKSVNYKSIARNPDNYKKQYVKINNCRVVQQIDVDNSSDIMAIVTVGGYNNVMYLSIPGFKDWEWTGSFAKSGVSRLLEGDRINIQGIGLGSYTYTTINNQTLTVPYIEVDNMWLYD